MLIQANQIPAASYQYGQTIEIKLSFTNKASETCMMSPFPPQINIELASTQLIVRSFSAGTQELQLRPSESSESGEYVLVWDQKDNSGQQVPAGWYAVEVTVVSQKAEETYARAQVVRSWATKVLVLPPEGAMEKTIEVNQSQTVNGITITLERLELSTQGMKVYAFNTPPDYKLPQGPMLPPPQFMIHAEAEYSTDGGAVRQAGPSGICILDNGIENIWDNLDAIPKDARELSFRITKLGDWQGSWEFHIALQ
jgi:hypothetical protein